MAVACCGMQRRQSDCSAGFFLGRGDQQRQRMWLGSMFLAESAVALLLLLVTGGRIQRAARRSEECIIPTASFFLLSSVVWW